MTKLTLRKEAFAFIDNKGVTHGAVRYRVTHTHECGHIYQSPYIYDEPAAKEKVRWLESGQQLCSQCHGISREAVKKIIDDEQRKSQ